jgi:CRISPR-associated endonuclease/helicase Cas3
VDVAVVFRKLAALPGPRRALEASAGTGLTEAQWDRLAVLALLHDLGKLNHGFQEKANPLARLGDTAGHIIELSALFYGERAEEAMQALDLETLADWVVPEPDAALHPLCRLLFASFSHHGNPQSECSWQGRRQSFGYPDERFWRKRVTRDPLAGITGLMAQARAVFPAAFATNVPPLGITPALEHRFAGLVMLADWIGSDQRFFPFRSDEAEGRAELAWCKADLALREIGLVVDGARQILAAQSPSFQGCFGKDPYPLQRALVETLPLTACQRLLVVESDTGSGKTEAAMAWFLRVFAAGWVDGLYFALPTRVAARELYERVERAIQALATHRPGGAPFPVLLAAPGYVQYKDPRPDVLGTGEGEQYPDPEDGPRDPAAYWRQERAWAAQHPKRFLAAPVAVGTIDQALLSAIQTKHAHLRSVLLDRQLLVVDEVHASDPYMRYLLHHLLRGHLARGGAAVLLSATLGEVARAAFVGEGAAPLPLAAAVAIPYPCITDLSGQPLGVPSPPGREKRIRVGFEDRLAAEDLPWLVEQLAQALASGARILVVCNTVGRAVALQRAVEADARISPAALFSVDGVVCPHHGRYARADRERMDAAVTARYGRDTPAGPALLIGTQTLEQSLDLDADLLVTDHCPMDVLLQRIGRLHRHQRPRPAGHTEPRCLVLSIPEAGLRGYIQKNGEARGAPAGMGLVYPDLRVLALTRRVLEKSPAIEIPRDNRRLVEETTHPEALARLAGEAEGEDWKRHGDTLTGSVMGQRIQGQFAILEEKPFGSFHFPGKLDGNIATRLGLRDRLARLPHPVPSPFGQKTLDEIPIPGHLVPTGDFADVTDATDVSVTKDEIAFRLGDRSYRYSRLGLEQLRDDGRAPNASPP